MTEILPVIRAERSEDRPLVLALEKKAFGPGRFARTAYRVREMSTAPEAISLVAFLGQRLVGAIRFTAISIGGQDGALLLGPLVVDPDNKGQGTGIRLLQAGLTAARDQKYSLVILVGDLAYYQRLGFQTVPAGQIMLPGPVDPQRLLGVELTDGVLSSFSGTIKAP